jgi:Glycosyltransferase Family 4
MRIAQISPLPESLPPKLYGGTERFVAWLVEELVELGHQVTLFASGDSRNKAELVPVCPRALRLGKPRPDPVAAQTALLEAVAQRAREFDVILVIMIGSISSRAISGTTPFPSSLAGTFVLILVHWIISYFTRESTFLSYLAKGIDTVFIRDGKVDRKALAASHMSHDGLLPRYRAP